VAPVLDADVDLLVDFLNTVDEEEGTDELSDDPATAAWLRDHSLSLSTDISVDSATARAIRTALRDAAAEAGAPTVFDAVPVTLGIGPDGEPALTSPHPLGRLLITAVRLGLEDRWQRIKLCDMHTCRYAYYDGSRNTSGRWCSMKVCGNRAKTRAFRERHRTE
jgi:predicted RNA-binding Zn ribbon-like protein